MPAGRGEAADALRPSAASNGCGTWVLPQAFRIGIPPIGNQYLNLIQNSSLGAGIGYYDLTLVTQTTVSSEVAGSSGVRDPRSSSTPGRS